MIPQHKYIELAFTTAADYYGATWQDILYRKEHNYIRVKRMVMYALGSVLSQSAMHDLFELNADMLGRYNIRAKGYPFAEQLRGLLLNYKHDNRTYF